MWIMNQKGGIHVKCNQCPRACNVDRDDATGYCGAPWEFLVARAALHHWEEPQISGTNGSGTIFFCGCNLRCVYCQNRTISRMAEGARLSEDALIEVMLRLQDAGAHNINLVTPSHYAHPLARVLARVRPSLSIPVVYNCGGYESLPALRALDGLIDIYLPDIKYYDAELSKRYSGVSDYFEVAVLALTEMLRQTGAPVTDEAGLLRRGTVVRHLVLPGSRADSIAVLGRLAELFGTDAFLLSLMSQYTPDFAMDTPYRQLYRRLTTFEYDSVLDEVRRLGFSGNLQALSSADAGYTPDFEEKSFLP